MTGRKDIRNNGSKLNEELLMAYLDGKLQGEERRRVEELLSEEGMESDAAEGLQVLGSDEARRLSSRINHKLHYEIRNRNRKGEMVFRDNKWSWMAVAIVLLLAVLGYVVIKIATD